MRWPYHQKFTADGPLRWHLEVWGLPFWRTKWGLAVIRKVGQATLG